MLLHDDGDVPGWYEKTVTLMGCETYAVVVMVNGVNCSMTWWYSSDESTWS